MPKKKVLQIHRSEIITALKKRFTCNNPESWGDNSDSQLLEWYKEYIDTENEIEMI